MRPAKLKTRIFLDGGDPGETGEAIKLLGFLDGQTTNPTLIAKTFQNSTGNPLDFYKKVVKEISRLIPNGSVSIEVVDEDMLKQAVEMNSWIPNAHIKFPTTKQGLPAAEKAIKMGIKVNMTLVFSQEQAAAVYSATKHEGADVFVSPFVGRLDDKGENGMDLIRNILKMYESSDHHVAVLTASVRNLNHFMQALAIGSDIITAPFKVLKEWAEITHLKDIPYKDLDLNQDWKKFNIKHELTDKGIEKFASDWNALIK